MKKTGKKIKYINSNIYSPIVSGDNFSYDNFFSEIPDSIRYFSKNYWSQHGDHLVVANTINQDNMFEIEHLDDSTILLKANKSKFTKDIIDENGILEKNFDKEKWLYFLTNIIPSSNNIFYDYSFDIPELLDVKKLPNDSNKNICYLDKSYKYNFYSQNYESLINDRTFSETSIPYMMSLLNNPSLDTRTYEENLILTLGGLIPDDYAESLFLAKEYNENVIKYFDSYAEAYRNTNSLAFIQNLEQIAKLMKVKENQIETINNVTFVPFPFYTDIKFSNLSDNNFVEDLKNIGYIKDELQNYMNSNLNLLEKNNFIISSDIVQENSINSYDVKEWIESGLSGNVISISDRPSAIEYGKLINYINQNIKVKTRNYDELNSAINFSEVLFYKIEKRVSGYDTNNIIQTLWYDVPKTDIIRFIDTQVKYSTDYYYSVYAYVMVAGNKYSYSNFYDNSGWTDIQTSLLQKNDINDGLYRLKINNKPSYKIFEIPISKFNLSINEDPYTKPIVKIEKDKDNIRINILESAEESFDNIKIIENKDFKTLESIKKSQNNFEKDKIYCQKNKKTIDTLQIYRTTIKPINYLSFQGKLYKTLSLYNDKTFVDYITPGIKYYYAFRYLNNHETPSDLSNITEIMLKDEDGYSYLDIKETTLEPIKENILFKPFKKYILVRPSLIQTQLQLNNPIMTSKDIILGPQNNSIWGKQFILKVTSKKTNRIIEFNLSSIIDNK